MIWPLALVAVAGCGRLGFAEDVTGDVAADADRDAPPGGHDEDGDGFADSVDNCPHLPNDQKNADSDGVGDICDREPAAGGQTITRFATMQPGDAPLTPRFGTTVQLADAVMFDGAGALELFHHVPIANTDIWVGIDLVDIGPLPRQLAVEVTDLPSDAHYYGELYESGTGGHVAITHFDAPGYTTVELVALAGAVHTGPVTMLLATTQAPPEMGIAISWPGEPYVVTAATPQLAPVGRFDVFAENLAIELRYFVVITSP